MSWLNKQTTPLRLGIILASLALLLFVVVYAVGQGSVEIPFKTAWESLIFSNQDKTTEAIVHNLRLPRILIATFAGMALAASGCVLVVCQLLV